MFVIWKVAQHGPWEIVGPFKDHKTLEAEIERQGRNPQEVFVLETNVLRSGGKFPDNPLRVTP